MSLTMSTTESWIFNQVKQADILCDCIWFHGFWLWAHILPFYTSRLQSFHQPLFFCSAAHHILFIPPHLWLCLFSADEFAATTKGLFAFSQHLVSLLQLPFQPPTCMNSSSVLPDKVSQAIWRISLGCVIHEVTDYQRSIRSGSPFIVFLLFAFALKLFFYVQ